MFGEQLLQKLNNKNKDHDSRHADLRLAEDDVCVWRGTLEDIRLCYDKQDVLRFAYRYSRNARHWTQA